MNDHFKVIVATRVSPCSLRASSPWSFYAHFHGWSRSGHRIRDQHQNTCRLKHKYPHCQRTWITKVTRKDLRAAMLMKFWFDILCLRSHWHLPNFLTSNYYKTIRASPIKIVQYNYVSNNKSIVGGVDRYDCRYVMEKWTNSQPELKLSAATYVVRTGKAPGS